MKRTIRIVILLFVSAPQYTLAQCPQIDFGPDTIICSGTSITLDAENFGATYLWNDGSITPQIETFFEGEYSVEVTRDGCTVSDTIYVQHGPVIYADFGYVQTSFCTPLVAEFYEFSQACSGAVTEWIWDFGDGTTSSERNPVHNYSISGEYTVSLTVRKNTGSTYTAQQVIAITGGMSPIVELGDDKTLCMGNELILSAGNPGAEYSWSTGELTESISVYDEGKYTLTVTKDGCSVIDSINVDAIPIIWSDFTFAKLSGCLPVTYRFTDNSSSCNESITSWFWEFGDGTTSMEQNPEHEFTSEGEYAVKLTVTDNSGNSIKRSRKVTIQPAVITVDLGADTTICFGNSLSLDAGNQGYEYLWSTGETTQQISAMDDGEYSVTVNAYGCLAKDTIQLNTSSAVDTKFGYTKGTQCLPVTVGFTDSSQLYCGQSITGWAWDFGDGTTSTSQHPEHNYSSVDSFTVKLTVTTSGGTAASRTIRIGISNTVSTLELPSQLKVCTGESIQVDAMIKDAQYTWSPSYGVSNSAIRNPSITPIMNTWYVVDVKKCMVDLKDSVYLVVDSITKPLIIQDNNFLKSSEASAYQWYRDGKKLGGANSKVLRIDRQGYYSVKIYNKSGCERESDTKFYLPLSGKEKKDEVFIIKCSPNPTHGLFNILLSHIPEKPVKLSVSDRHGRVFFQTYIRDHVNPLNLYKVAKGLYFVEVTINNKKKIIPVVVR